MKKSVLIADPKPRCYSQLRKKLIANNYHVFHAANVEDAMAHFDIKTADLILLDLDVPEERICNDLSKLAQLNPSVRIIGVTERSEGSEIAVRERLDGVAEKPLAFRNLISFIQELLRNPSPWKEFRYMAPRKAGLRERSPHRTHHLSKHPPIYSGWGINE
jgi:DNA-binding response OmpR family regulator